MGAYENPSQLVDEKSALYKAQGIQGFTEGIVKGALTYGTAMAKQAEEARKNKKAADLSLIKDNETALKDTEQVVNKINEDNTNNVTTTSLGEAIQENAQTDVVKALQEIKNKPGSLEANNAQKYILQTNTDYKLLGDAVGDLDLLLKGYGTSKYSDKWSTPYISQLSEGTGVTTTSDFFRDKNGKNKAIVTWQSDTIRAMNAIMGPAAAALDGKYSIDLLNLGPASNNPNVFGFPKAGLIGVTPYDIGKTIEEHNAKENMDVRTVLSGKNLLLDNETKVYSTSYKDAKEAVVGAGIFAQATADSLLRQRDLAHLPANAYYDELLKNNVLKKRPDGSLYMVVPGEEINGEKKLFSTNAELRNADRSLKTDKTVELDIPYIYLDPTGKDNIQVGNNLYTKEGYDGLVNVIKYQKLNAEGWLKSTKGELLETREQTETPLGELLTKELDAIDIKLPGDFNTLTGLTDKEAVSEGARYKKDNINKHRKYLEKKGIKAKTREEVIRYYKSLEGQKVGTSNDTYGKDDIESWINGMEDYELFDDANEPFISYEHDNSRSLIPILQNSGLYLGATKEDLARANISR